jgi:DNA-binding Lrp family transcriptional regulator
VAVEEVARETARVGSVEVDFWIVRSFEEAEEVIIECDSGDSFEFALYEPVYGSDGYRVVVDEDGYPVAVARNMEELKQFVLRFVDCEELERQGVEHVDATIR